MTGIARPNWRVRAWVAGRHSAGGRERFGHAPRWFLPLVTETMMTKTIPPVPQDNQSHKGPGSAPSVPLDTTKGHRDDEKNNIREQAEHGNMTQNTSNRRSG